MGQARVANGLVRLDGAVWRVALGRGGGVVVQYGPAEEGARLLVRNEELFGADPGLEAGPESGRASRTRRSR